MRILQPQYAFSAHSHYVSYHSTLFKYELHDTLYENKNHVNDGSVHSLCMTWYLCFSPSCKLETSTQNVTKITVYLPLFELPVKTFYSILLLLLVVVLLLLLLLLIILLSLLSLLLSLLLLWFLAHPVRRTRWAYAMAWRPSSVRPSFRPSVRPQFSKCFFFVISQPILILIVS